MSQSAKPRASSHGRLLLRASRPSALKLHRGTHSSKSVPSPKKPSSKRDSHIDLDDDYSDEMAGLPSFCAACEKQIMNPHATFLYCSEACRRKDGTYVTPPTQDAGIPSPPFFPGMEMDDDPLPDIVPQRSPTLQRPSVVSSISDISDERDSDGNYSEAAKYLSQFLTMGNSDRPSGTYYRNKSTSSNGTLPSLSHTPSTDGSIMSSYNDSMSRTAPSKLATLGYRHSQSRSSDLFTRTNNGSTTSLRSKSSTKTAFRTVEADITYEKRPMATTPISSPSQGSLKQLFAHDAMRRVSRGSQNTPQSSLSRLGP